MVSSIAIKQSFVCTYSLFYLTHREELIKSDNSESEWNLARWQWRGTSHSPKLQHYWSLSDCLVPYPEYPLVGVLPLCKNAVSEFTASLDRIWDSITYNGWYAINPNKTKLISMVTTIGYVFFFREQWTKVYTWSQINKHQQRVPTFSHQWRWRRSQKIVFCVVNFCTGEMLEVIFISWVDGSVVCNLTFKLILQLLKQITRLLTVLTSIGLSKNSSIVSVSMSAIFTHGEFDDAPLLLCVYNILLDGRSAAICNKILKNMSYWQKLNPYSYTTTIAIMAQCNRIS